MPVRYAFVLCPSFSAAPSTAAHATRIASSDPCGGRDPRPRLKALCLSWQLAIFAKILQIFGGLVLGCIKTKSCKKIIIQNMRLTAFFKLYKICTLLHRCNLKMLAKNRFEKSPIFVKIQQHFADVAKFAKFCQISKISAC